MMQFFIISIFPDSLDSYLSSSIIKRAQKNKLIKIKIINPRDFTKGRRQIVDDKPFGGGPGMVIKPEPILKSVQVSKSKIPAQGWSASGGKSQKSKIILLSPRGKQFTQIMAKNWAKKYQHLILISGHYEGIDERVKKSLRAEEISIGPYILTGGELPAMVVIDAMARHIKGVLGREESLEEKRGSYPAYTRPEVLEYKGKKYRVPKVLLSGNHKKIEEWRKKYSK